MTTRTAYQLREDILSLMPDLQRERDVMPHRKLRLGELPAVDPASLRYRAVSRALDHLLEAVNELSHVIGIDARDPANGQDE